MGRKKLTPEQRIRDLFLEMGLDQQEKIVQELADLYRFCKKRDSAMAKPTDA